ncbi:MAG: hypothetical protein HQ517_12680, partial [SAR324 cluster bacterium]|nr:hypothetical protein [SAR324 cluster bacterium]
MPTHMISIWMGKLIKLIPHKRWAVIALVFCTLQIPSVECLAETTIDDFYNEIAAGKYTSAVEIGKKYIKETDSAGTWENPYDRANLIALIGRFSALYSDTATSSWAVTELKQFIDDKTQPFELTMGIAFKSDAILMANMGFSFEERKEFLLSFREMKAISYLSHGDLIDFLLECAKVFNQDGDKHYAELFAHRALGIAAFSENTSPHQVARTISSLMLLYADGGRTRILPELMNILAELEDKKVLNPDYPFAHEITANVMEVLVDYAPSQGVIPVFENIQNIIKDGDSEVPYLLRINLFTLEATANAMVGNIKFFDDYIPEFKRYMGSGFEPNSYTLQVLQLIEIYAKFNAGVALTTEELSSLNTDIPGRVGSFQKIARFSSFLDETVEPERIVHAIDEIRESMISPLISGNARFSYQRQPSSYDVQAREQIYRVLEKKYGKKLPGNVANSVFRFISKTNGVKADFLTRGQIEIERAKDPELAIQIKRFLKLSEERETITVITAKKAAAQAIAYAERDYSYKEQDVYENRITWDFLRLDEQLSSIYKFIIEKDNKVLERIFFPDLRVDDVAKEIKKGEAIFYYDLSGSYIFSCRIESEKSVCGIRPFNHEKFQVNLADVRAAVTDPSQISNPYPYQSAYS